MIAKCTGQHDKLTKSRSEIATSEVWHATTNDSCLGRMNVPVARVLFSAWEHPSRGTHRRALINDEIADRIPTKFNHVVRVWCFAECHEPTECPQRFGRVFRLARPSPGISGRPQGRKPPHVNQQ